MVGLALTLVDDGLEADHGEQAAAHGGARYQTQNDDAKQAPGVPARRLLQQELPFFLCNGHGLKEAKVVGKEGVARQAASRSSRERRHG